MSDRREAILARLLEILQGISGVTTIDRNLDQMPDQSRSCIVLMDGGEVISDTSHGHYLESVVMIMEPIIGIGVSSSPENIGSEINAIRAKIIPAVLGDSELKTLANKAGSRADHPEIYYRGLDHKIQSGMMMAFDMQLNFAIHYLLDPMTLN